LNLDTNTILIVAGVIAALIVLLLLLRPRKQRPTIERRAEGEGPYVASNDRPYMRPPEPQPTERKDGAQGNSVADEVATATSDVAGEMLGVGARAELPGAIANPDELTLLKGVGPKFAARLNELGFGRYEQLAGLCDNEVAMLDEKLGPFRGRLVRDRVIEQARYLARGDRDGFEAQFGKIGGGTGAPGEGDAGGGMPTIRG